MWSIIDQNQEVTQISQKSKASRAIIVISGIIHKAFTNKIEAKCGYANYRFPKLLSLANIIRNYSTVLH